MHAQDGYVTGHGVGYGQILLIAGQGEGIRMRTGGQRADDAADIHCIDRNAVRSEVADVERIIVVAHYGADWIATDEERLADFVGGGFDHRDAG